LGGAGDAARGEMDGPVDVRDSIAAGKRAFAARTSKPVPVEVDILCRMCVMFSSLEERKSVAREMTNCP